VVERAPVAEQITGLVLCGGRGSRVEGRDKGLLIHEGEPLVQRALRRLAPQVAHLAISANRHLDDYAALGVPVWPDERPGFEGPLSGWLTALHRAPTPWLASVPCDAPDLPDDLVARLAHGLAAEGAELAIAVTPHREHPVCALLSRALAERLAAALDAGERRVLAWALDQRCARVRFDDEAAFRNLNRLEDFTAPR